MKKITVLLVVFVILFVASVSMAQVDFTIVRSPGNSDLPPFRYLGGDVKTIVEFLYLTEKDDACVEFEFGEVCVFDDPFVEGAQHLYTRSGGYLLILYEGLPIALPGGRSGIAYLPDGEYQVMDFDTERVDGHSSWIIEGILTFSIGETESN